ncbi:hypothetical protein GCM10007304_12750 [Rhodococcoides trifolii]|uniref:Uncharacterized protein n=1 Tax=Rhodococcoides trifolii TaxID=908250 RepID=A0A917FRU8_9NOCA|nr:hypothetical protein [Rhodococcus trifolii]GGG00268.1 hypothetical protein GCM10007304_12750 [Rhodococcus trifolii]
MRYLPGSERVLAQQQSSLPQPEQLCGPFWVDVALRALTGASPGITDIARSAGTLVYPHDLPAYRPASVMPRTVEWAGLPTTDDPNRSGTDADGVHRALAGVHVVPVTGRFTGDGVRRLLASLADGDPVVVIANVHTSFFADADDPRVPWSWPVGHFVALIGFDDAGVAVADSYPIGSPPGQYAQSLDAVAVALTRDGYGGGGVFVVGATEPNPAVTGSLHVGMW